MDGQGTSLDQLPGGNMGGGSMATGTPPSMDGHGNPALMANQQLQQQGQDSRMMMQGEEPVYDDEEDYGHEHPLQQYQVTNNRNKGWMAYIMDTLLGQLKEPLIVAVIVVLINLKPVRNMIFNYAPTESLMLFGIIKALIAAVIFFVAKKFI